MYQLLGIAIFVIILFGLVNLAKPLARLKVTSRLQAAQILFIGLFLLFAFAFFGALPLKPALFINITILLIGFGVINIVKPLAIVKMEKRKHAVFVSLGGFVSLIVAFGVFSEDLDSDRMARLKVENPVAYEQALARRDEEKRLKEEEKRLREEEKRRAEEQERRKERQLASARAKKEKCLKQADELWTIDPAASRYFRKACQRESNGGN